LVQLKDFRKMTVTSDNKTFEESNVYYLFYIT